MIFIGVDPHKLTHTATAVESATNTDLASIRVEASLEEYRRLLRWAGSWPERTWAVENADGLGNHLAQWLVAAGETVLDVAASATARVRQLSRGGRRKNDRIDAAAAACVAALQGDARRVAPDDASTSLRLLDERRTNVSSSRTRAVNQLRALLRELLAGGAPADLSAPKAAALLRTIRPATATARVRKQLAQELVADIRRYDTQLATNAEEMSRIPGRARHPAA